MLAIAEAYPFANTGGLGDLGAALPTVASEASAMVHVRAQDTSHLEEALERIRDRPGVTRTQTQIVPSTLFERPFGSYGGARVSSSP